MIFHVLSLNRIIATEIVSTEIITLLFNKSSQLSSEVKLK